MKYYYNEQEKSFYIPTNFIPVDTPNGFIEITKEQYEELIKELLEQENQDN